MATKVKEKVAKKEVPIENRYKCSSPIWRKFADRQKIIYNNMRSHRMKDLAPIGAGITAEHWEILSHNFACMAAWEYSVKDYKVKTC